MLEGAAQLHEVLPHCSLRDESLGLLEVSDHPAEVSGVRQLQHNIEFVGLDEGGQVPDDVLVVQLLQQLDLLHAVQSGLGVGHLKDLHLLQRHHSAVLLASE